jgi:hypothetical protein
MRCGIRRCKSYSGAISAERNLTIGSLNLTRKIPSQYRREIIPSSQERPNVGE